MQQPQDDGWPGPGQSRLVSKAILCRLDVSRTLMSVEREGMRPGYDEETRLERRSVIAKTAHDCSMP